MSSIFFEYAKNLGKSRGSNLYHSSFGLRDSGKFVVVFLADMLIVELLRVRNH